MNYTLEMLGNRRWVSIDVGTEVWTWYVSGANMGRRCRYFYICKDVEPLVVSKYPTPHPLMVTATLR